MMVLSLGPSEMLGSVFLNDRSKLAVLKIIAHFHLPEVVPVDGSGSNQELAATLNVDEALLTRVLRYATRHGIFKEIRGTSITHDAVSMALREYDKLFELQTADLTILPLVQIYRVLGTWHRRDDDLSRQRGINYALGKGSDMWDIIKAEQHDTKGSAWFSATMRSWSEATARLAGPVVDLGGNGHVSIELARRFSSPTFIVYDLDVSDEAKAQLSGEFEGRINYHVQDSFRPQPADLKPSAYPLESVLHDWPDEDCAKILRNLIPKMESHNIEFMIMERWMPEGDENMSRPIEANIRPADLLMFSLFGSSERTIEQWTDVVKVADPRLEIEKVVTMGGSECVVMQLLLEND